MTLDKLRTKNTLKRLKPEALQELADDIREFLIGSISTTGGHLASNLGVVEITLALHAVFSTPRDKIVWDVGHQAYVHKILTGRKGRFAELRKQNGLSGFPKPCESEHDAFGTGHSSTAISAALGLAKARDIRKKNFMQNSTGSSQEPVEKIIAVVGDGSITGGLAYEGLNNAGRANTDLLVILNDNQMSISKNVGAVARHLNTLRTASAYLGAKEDVHYVLDKLPLIGDSISRGIRSAKDMLKYAILPGVLFEEMGFKYIGPVDGHDISALLTTLKQVKNVKGPVLLHIITTKGKGYNIAEKSPGRYHGVGRFNIQTGEPASAKNTFTYTDVFAKFLCKSAARNEKIVAITAAMPDGTGLFHFKERYPTRFFDVGIAEGHAVTFAAGLAAGGLRPVVAIYSTFLQRAYGHIIHDVAIPGLPVIFAIDHAGAVSGDGETHQGIYDIAFLSHIPGMTILAPSSDAELIEMFDYALSLPGPVAIRYPKAAAPVGKFEKSEKISTIRLQEGKKIAIVSVGCMLETAQEVSARLAESGANPALYNARVIKPLDKNLTDELNCYNYVFTIEDGARLGGYGQTLAAHLQKPTLKNFAFPDIFPETATRKELFTRYELDAESIYQKILEVTANGKQKKTKSRN